MSNGLPGKSDTVTTDGNRPPRVVRGVLRFWWVGLLLSLTVILVIPLFASIVDLKIDKAFSDMTVLRTGLSQFQTKHQRFPTTAEGLGVLVPDFVLRVSRDPWGNAYAYRTVQVESYFLYSIGVDGRDEGGAGDDVTTPRKKYDRATYGVTNATDALHIIGYVSFAILMASSLAGLARGVASVRSAVNKNRGNRG